VNHFLRSGLIVALSLSAGLAYLPSAVAKKDHSSDEKKEKDKDQNDQPKQKSNNQQQFFQNSQQSSNSQKSQSSSKSKKEKSDNVQHITGGQPQNNQPQDNNQSQTFQKQFQSQNFQKQQQPQGNQKQWPNFQKQNNQQQNLQQSNNKNKWQNKSHKDHKELKNFVVQFGGPQPFSDKWYKDHPHAWHHRHHDHDDAWKVVTAAGVLGFLGWEVYHPRNTVVIYEPVSYDRLFVSEPGIVIDPSRGDWMPLGVYSLMLGPDDASTRMLDLAIDRHGHIRGSYYDMISGASYNVAGVIDARTQYAQWSLESNRQLTFYTPLNELMQPQGIVTVRLPSGQRQEWQLVRMEDVAN